MSKGQLVSKDVWGRTIVRQVRRWCSLSHSHTCQCIDALYPGTIRSKHLVQPEGQCVDATRGPKLYDPLCPLFLCQMIASPGELVALDG